MALTPNGIVTISGTPANIEQETQDSGLTAVDGVIAGDGDFVGIGTGATQQGSEVFGVNGDAVFGDWVGINTASEYNGENLRINGSMA